MTLTKEGTDQFKDPHKFTVTESGDAFEILSSGLYSDPRKAILRELSTNAVDSHIEAKISRPFEVHLPTIKDPYFWIRDYGTGLSNQDVREIWCSYFNSTKRGKGLIGKFGLGAKSPLSYVNSFSLVSWYEGKQTRWIVRLTPERVPEILEEKAPGATKEPNGIKIRFAVPPKDFCKFEDAAKEVYAYFDMMPKFVGTDNIVIEKPEYFMFHKGDTLNWGIRKEYKESQVIMGGVAYPIKNTEVARQYQDGIDLYVEPETFSITPNREALRYTQETKDGLTKMLQLVEEQAAQKLVAEYKTITGSFREKYERYWDSMLYTPILCSSKEKVQKLLVAEASNWNKRKDRVVKIGVDDTQSRLSVYLQPHEENASKEKYAGSYFGLETTRGAWFSRATTSRIFWEDRTPVIIVMDKRSSMKSKIDYFQLRQWRQIYLLYTKSVKRVVSQLEELGLEPILLSTLPQGPKDPAKTKEKRISSKERKARSEVRGCYTLDKAGNYAPVKNKSGLEGKKYKVILSGSGKSLYNRGVSPSNMQRLLQQFGLGDSFRRDELIYIHRTYQEEYPQFQALTDYVEGIVCKIPANYDMGLYLVRLQDGPLLRLVSRLRTVTATRDWSEKGKTNYHRSDCSEEEQLRRSDIVFQLDIFKQCSRQEGETFSKYMDRLTATYSELLPLLSRDYTQRKLTLEAIAKDYVTEVEKLTEMFVLANPDLFSAEVRLREMLGFPVTKWYGDIHDLDYTY